MNNDDIRVLNTNPYIDASVLIGANHEYTSPFLNVYEEKKEKFHSSISGVNLGGVVHTIYYNSKAGKFERKNFNSATLRKIEDPKLSESSLTSINLDGVSLKDFEIDFYEKFNNKLVILKSVDLELKKKAIKETNDLDISKFTTSAHLEFLPPVMTIIGYKFSDDKKKVCDDTGAIKLEFKCKWYNSAAKTFSEEFLPYQVLAFIDNKQEISNKLVEIKSLIEKQQICQFPLKNSIVFKDAESNDINTNLKFGLFTINAVVWNHYTYQLIVKSLITNKTETSNSLDFKIVKELFSNEAVGFFKPGEYFLIKYKDKFKNITNRIIYINHLIYDNQTYNSLDVFIEYYNSLSDSDKNKLKDNLIYNANCLLRRGEIRNFRLQGMLEITPINRFGDNQSFFDSEYVEEN